MGCTLDITDVPNGSDPQAARNAICGDLDKFFAQQDVYREHCKELARKEKVKTETKNTTSRSRISTRTSKTETKNTTSRSRLSTRTSKTDLELPCTLSPKTRVKLRGLKKLSFNGKMGITDSFDKQSQRWIVKMDEILEGR